MVLQLGLVPVLLLAFAAYRTFFSGKKRKQIMKFIGMWNFGGGGTEIVTGVANENLPSHTENIGYNEKVLNCGEFGKASFIVDLAKQIAYSSSSSASTNVPIP